VPAHDATAARLRRWLRDPLVARAMRSHNAATTIASLPYYSVTTPSRYAIGRR
jgi:hypothetical protein